ncbi:few polyhedra [Lambdina fiscellaria nucleopolyhedrovirus]|uniref:Few polyhedra n=1 Tax=Lambdina fiscellaria nucleopolyhedrovirus TaxID=1642929 RepID=A0A0E3URC1_9ABAC|nr:few polyhedra [Lambdina fiscellaria nucleopolyhedrovirus]AKC91710.1 few polyhedra [Lambdina fiscellaria nucleopolyhedrovirus]
MELDFINVPKLKSLIRNEVDRTINKNLHVFDDKIKKLEKANLNSSVEIYGVRDSRLSDRKVRQHYVKKICALLSLDTKLIVDSEFRKNHIYLKLNDAATAREWQARSCAARLKNYDLNVQYDAPVKMFVAASHEHKQLLKKTRDCLLPHYKYVSLCKLGVMVRENDTSKIYIIKNENEIKEFLNKAELRLNNKRLFANNKNNTDNDDYKNNVDTNNHKNNNDNDYNNVADVNNDYKNKLLKFKLFLKKTKNANEKNIIFDDDNDNNHDNDDDNHDDDNYNFDNDINNVASHHHRHIESSSPNQTQATINNADLSPSNANQDSTLL